MLEGCQVLAVLLQSGKDHTAVLPQKHTKETIKQNAQLSDAPKRSLLAAMLPTSYLAADVVW